MDYLLSVLGDAIICIPLILVLFFIIHKINKACAKLDKKYNVTKEQKAESKKWTITWICGIIGVACAFTGILIPVTFAMGAIIKQAWKQYK